MSELPGTNEPVSTESVPYGTLPPASPVGSRKPVSLPRLGEMRARGEKITMVTAYDATLAAVADNAGVDCILVGDSVGMVVQGLNSTVGVTLEAMRYHTECTVRGVRRVQGTAWIIADMPFASYHESPEQAFRNAAVLMQAGAHMVKLEGGGWTADTARFLVDRVWPSRPDAADRSLLGRLPCTGPRHCHGRPTAQRRTRLARRGCQPAGAGDGAGAPLGRTDAATTALPYHRHWRRQ